MQEKQVPAANPARHHQRHQARKNSGDLAPDRIAAILKGLDEAYPRSNAR